MHVVIADSTEVGTWLTPDIAAMGVSVASFIVVGLLWMARRAAAHPFNAFDALDSSDSADADDDAHEGWGRRRGWHG